MFKFNIKYFTLTIILFIAEVVIAMYVHDRFIRPYFGDFLVTIFVYCGIKSFFDTPVGSTAVWVLLFAYAVEVTQHFRLVYRLGWGDSQLACAIMGTHFSFIDMLMYTFGIILVLFAEMYVNDTAVTKLSR
jgi:hypothetical protein